MAATKTAKPNRATKRAAERRFVRSRYTTTSFEDGGEFDGLSVRTRRVSIDELFDIVEQAGDLPTSVTEMTPEQIELTRQLLEQFAGFLVSWNLDQPVLDADGEETDEVEPVAATYAGLMAQDFGFVFTLFVTWTMALGDVAVPLDPTSSAGGLSAVPPIPMDELSASQPS